MKRNNATQCNTDISDPMGKCSVYENYSNRIFYFLYFLLDGFRPYRYHERLDITLVGSSLNTKEATLTPLVAPRVSYQLEEKIQFIITIIARVIVIY